MNNRFLFGFTAAAAMAVISLGLTQSGGTPPEREWREYLGGPDRNHYSALMQIDSTNVHRLVPAWQYHTGAAGQMQCSPLVVDGILYGLDANTQPFALHAATGTELWKALPQKQVTGNTGRGLVYWEEGADKRILYSNGAWLYACDAATGAPVLHFGDSGRVSLKAGLGATAQDKYVVSNTPGTVFEHLIIMPTRVSEGADAAPGYIQAFDIRSGKLAWVFRTIPAPGEYGYATWPKTAYKNNGVGGANNWAGMAVDRRRGIVYVPTGSAAFDFYGGNRKGANLFANCLLALNARTGKRLWHFQFVHHDILDRDPPAPPNLVTVMHKGKKVDAVVQVTKQGFVFVFDRVNGTPLFPIVEKKAPLSDVPGEQAWPTQPVPLLPAPFARQTLTAADISPHAENKAELLAMLEKNRYAGPFTPLTQSGSIVFPGLDGGAEWGGAAADPEGVLYVNSNEMAWLLSVGPTQTPTKKTSEKSVGRRLYATHCMACHGPQRRGNPASGFPSLVDIDKRRNARYVSGIIGTGKGMMPGFPALTQAERNAVVSFLFGIENKSGSSTLVAKEPGLATPAHQAAYKITGFSKFLDKGGLPAITPPWGTLNAIDLNTGRFRWKVPFGEYPEVSAKGVPTGSESYGGPVVTASGLLFIAGTKDRKFRIYSKHTGRLLWETLLPAAAFATPITYEVDGKQYIAMACGGDKLGAPAGDCYMAFALP